MSSPRHSREEWVANQTIPMLTAGELDQLTELDRRREEWHGPVNDPEQRCQMLLDRCWPDQTKVEGIETIETGVRLHFTFYCDCAPGCELGIEHAYIELTDKCFLNDL